MSSIESENSKKRDAARRKRATMTAIILIVLVFVMFFVCISLGSVRIHVSDVFDAILGHQSDWGVNDIVNTIRAPRVLGAAIVGASLSLGGMTMQALFKNPIASPSVLGISSGASFGAAFYIAFGSAIIMSPFGTIASAFGMSILSMLLVYALAHQKSRGVQTTMLLLAGMAMSALFSGLTSMIQFFSDEDTVTAIVFWTLGSFDGLSWSDLIVMTIPAIIGSVLILLNLRELNLITAGETKARALGVNVKNVRLVLIIGSSLLVAGTVSVCGVISFVGLIIPHIFRFLVGPEHKRLAPICMLGGALFLMIVDTFSRSFLPPYELPIGVTTSIIGAPFFIWILRSRKNEVWRN